MKTTRVGPFLSFFLVASSACGTTYQPQSHHRLSATTKSYVKDEVVYDRGFFGGQLRELTGEVDRARVFAEDMRTSSILTFTFQMSSLAAVAPYLAFAVGDGADSAGAWTSVSISAVLGLMALVLEARTAALERDAMNAYNDARPVPPIEGWNPDDSDRSGPPTPANPEHGGRAKSGHRRSRPAADRSTLPARL